MDVANFPPLHRLRKLLTRLLLSTLLVVVSLGAALLLGEGVTRLAFRDVTSTADGRSYFGAHQMRTRTNGLGFRERDLVMPKPAGLYRIAVIGDSFTFGQGLPEYERFSNVLGTYVDAQRYEVVNFGMPGHEMAEHLAVLRDIVLPATPDFVLLQLYVNDFEGPDMQRPYARPLLPFAEIDRRLYKSSALYSVATIEWGTIQGALGMFEPYPAYMRRYLEDPVSPQSQRAFGRLRDFIHTCQSHGVGVAIVFFPNYAFDLTADYPFDYLHDRVAETCGVEQIRCVDLRAAFAKVRPAMKLWVNRFDSHPSAVANRIAADNIIIALGPIWLGRSGSARRDRGSSPDGSARTSSRP